MWLDHDGSDFDDRADVLLDYLFVIIKTAIRLFSLLFISLCNKNTHIIITTALFIFIFIKAPFYYYAEIDDKYIIYFNIKVLYILIISQNIFAEIFYFSVLH